MEPKLHRERTGRVKQASALARGNRGPAHPGAVLREYLPADLGVTEAARHLGVTRQALSALINGRAGVSAAMASCLEAALGTSAEMWLGMQTNFDLWQARKPRRPKSPVSRQV